MKKNVRIHVEEEQEGRRKFFLFFFPISRAKSEALTRTLGWTVSKQIEGPFPADLVDWPKSASGFGLGNPNLVGDANHLLLTQVFFLIAAFASCSMHGMPQESCWGPC